MSQNPLESDPPEFGSQPHCYIPTEPCDDGGKRWAATPEFAEYIEWLREDRKAPRQYARISRDFLAKLQWLNRPGSCLDEADNVELSDSVINEDGVHRIPVGRKVEAGQLPSDVNLIWMGELYSQHDNSASAHRVYFSDVSDLEGKPRKRVVVGGGGTKDQVRRGRQTTDIAKAMVSVTRFAANEKSQVRPPDPTMYAD